MLSAGDQLPVIPLLEIVGSGGKGSPPQINWLIPEKIGTIALVTTTVIFTGPAHCPTVGVKVYVVVARLLGAGDQVPLIPLVDVAGSTIGVPVQTGVAMLNVGVTKGLTVTVKVVVAAHCPAFGVKV